MNGLELDGYTFFFLNLQFSAIVKPIHHTLNTATTQVETPTPLLLDMHALFFSATLCIYMSCIFGN